MSGCRLIDTPVEAHRGGALGWEDQEWICPAFL